jgi:hypothetical protein
VSNPLEQVEGAVRATRFHSATTYSWFGKMSPRIASSARKALTRATARKFLLYNLQNQLYSDFYCVGGAAPTPRRTMAYVTQGMLTPFVRALSEANAGRGYWESGWQAEGMEDDGRVIARRGDLTLRAKSEDYEKPDGVEVEAGAGVRLRFGKEFLALSPGFYMALGDSELAVSDARELARFYWNLTAEGAAPLMRLATTMLNEAGVTFRLKTLNDRGGYVRCDAAVLYVRKQDYEAVRPLVERIYPQVRAYLKYGTPAFTRRLAPGLGLAEDPGGEESFGQHRCRLLAEGMLMAHEQGRKSIIERVQVVEARFAEERIALGEAYLNPGSEDNYPFTVGDDAHRKMGDYSGAHVQLARSRNGHQHENGAGAPGADAYLRTAEQIGIDIAREAVWYQGQCNWIGATLQEAGRESGYTSLVYRALGPELYNGTAGIALFLAELHARTGTSDIRRTALGAIEQALAYAGGLPSSTRLGLHSGWPGVAYAADRAGALLGDDRLSEQALQLVKAHSEEETEGHEFDVLLGSAGAVTALLCLADRLGERCLTGVAARLGDGLLEAADKAVAGYSWGSPEYRFGRNLTGFSHGAAGIGWALLELFAATGEEKYRLGAERAFDYERHWFDPAEGNWPDFREMEARAGRNGPKQFMAAWCHGAPGIALSRLRAYQLLGDERYRAEALVALETTRRTIEATLRSETGNFSLCHGLAGNIEILLEGSRALGLDAPLQLSLAADVARFGMERYAGGGVPWPTGVPGGDTPGLMLGRAGTGLFYLRLYDPDLPSILLPGLESIKAKILTS